MHAVEDKMKMQEEFETSFVDSSFKRPPDDEKHKFYAVSLPDALSTISAQPLVFTSKTDALETIKKYSGARFKPFAYYDDAVEYASKPLLSIETQAPFTEEKSVFKSLSSQQMVSLRKTIETGDEVSFLDKVWSNPRYLINNAGDGPTVLQEGTRYNALHVAAKFKKTNMCLAILNTLHDVGFISGLYPNENPQKIRERIKRLIDLYLNTPDKSLSETPLHFACKFGADGVLSILLSFPQCDLNKCNKYGLSAREIICDRVSGNPDLKEKMLLMFEDLFYVPVLRDVANNIKEPVIGKPCRFNIVLEATCCSFSSSFSQKKTLTFFAFAGPMSQRVADKFFMVFSKKQFSGHLSFTPEQKKQLVDICLSDSEKGLERVGRKLAKTFCTGWIEFWPKLRFWGDLSSSEGLNCLESHLKHQYSKVNTSFSSLKSEAECDNFSNIIMNFVDEFVEKLPELLSNKNRTTFFVLFQSLLPYTFCMSEFSFSEEEQLSLIHYEIGQFLYLKLVESNREGFEAIKFYVNTQFISLFNFLDNLLSCGAGKWKMFLCILKYACYCQSSNILALKPPMCDCSWIVEKHSYTYSSSQCYNSVVKLKENFINHLASPVFSNRRKLCIFTIKDLSSKAITMPVSAEEREKTVLTVSENHPLNFVVTNLEGLRIEEKRKITPVATSPNMHQITDGAFGEYYDISKVFVMTVDKFCDTFCSVMSDYSGSIPFSTMQIFFDAFKQVALFFKPLHKFNFSQNCTLIFYHKEIALAVLGKMHNTTTPDVLLKWRDYFESGDFLNDKKWDFCQFENTDSGEWMHILCIIKHVCVLMIDCKHASLFCNCEFQSDCSNLTVNPHHCFHWLKFLQNKYKMCMPDLQCPSLPSDEEEEAEEFFTPPESPVYRKRDVFVNGEEFSDHDIDILRALLDREVEISQVHYPHIFSWKHLVESQLGSLLNKEDKLSCTPASSSASVRRALMPKKGVRRTLF